MSSTQSSKDHHSGGHFPHRHMELLSRNPHCDVVVAEGRSSNRSYSTHGAMAAACAFIYRACDS